MAYSPISYTVPQYTVSGAPASGYVLKAYSAGTSSVLQMATDNAGSGLANSFALNAQGFPITSGSSIIIPHVNASYKLALYPSQAAADANSGATWTIDNITTQEILGNISTPATHNEDYTLVLGDAGKTLVKTAADTTTRTWTIPLNSSVAFTVGTILNLINLDADNITIVSTGASTLKWLNGSAPTDGNRTLGQGGVATIQMLAADDWVIWGNAGLT